MKKRIKKTLLHTPTSSAQQYQVISKVSELVMLHQNRNLLPLLRQKLGDHQVAIRVVATDTAMTAAVKAGGDGATRAMNDRTVKVV